MGKRMQGELSSENAVARPGTGEAPPPVTPPAIAEGLPEPLRDAQHLARGGFGVVLRARDTALLRTVAVKVYDPPKSNAETVLRFRE